MSPELIKAAILSVLDEQKAEDILTISLIGKSALCDYMIIATGRSSRHVAALSELIEQTLSAHGVKSRYEGRDNGDWVLGDAGDVIVHIFRPEVRQFYNIEKLWVESSVPEPHARRTRALSSNTMLASA